MMTAEEKLEEMAIRDILVTDAYTRGVNNTLITISVIVTVSICIIMIL